MKKIPFPSRFVLILIGAVSLSTVYGQNDASKNSEIARPGWHLIWSDEFDGDEIDGSKWQYEVNAEGGGNHELQYYTDRDDNSYIEDGCLVIQANKEEFTLDGATRVYTSARLNTKTKFAWLYGRIDVRAMLPSGKGMWPAIWMLPEDEGRGRRAVSGEIDIMEYLGQETDRVYGTVHFDVRRPNDLTSSNDSYTVGKGEKDFAEDFHVFSLEWEADEIRLYVDDELYLCLNERNTKNSNFPAPIDKPFYLIINLAVGGNWPGSPDDSTQFPQKMLIDYVRVYTRP